MGETGFVVKADGKPEKNIYSDCRDQFRGLCTFIYPMAGMVSSTGLKDQMYSKENQRGGPSFWPPKQFQKFLKNSLYFILACEGERAASTSPNDVTGLTNKEIRKWFLFSSRNTLVEFPQQVSTSAFRENSSVLVIQQTNKRLPGGQLVVRACTPESKSLDSTSGCTTQV